MPSFDIVSKIDAQTLDNAINNLKKEILNRFDFQGTETTIELDKKNKRIEIVTVSDMKIDQVRDVMISKLMKQGIDPRCLDFGKEHYASGKMVRKDVNIREGIDKDQARKINTLIKQSGLKVTSQVMDDIVRVTAKKIDDLQAVIHMLRTSDIDIPLQYINMKS